jgi:hypothetical protein
LRRFSTALGAAANKGDDVIGKPRIYISGPMAGAPGSSYVENIRKGIDAAEAVERLGGVPYLPHTNALWGITYPAKDYKTIIERDLAWVEACHALVRIPGESRGADDECSYARELNIPVFHLEFAISTNIVRVVPRVEAFLKFIEEFREKNR